jgi:ElaA protein
MSGEVMSATVHRAWAADLDTRSLYELLRLRVDVFVVEQASPYSELDGRDLEEGARHYWLAGEGWAAPVLGCLRLLQSPTACSASAGCARLARSAGAGWVGS